MDSKTKGNKLFSQGKKLDAVTAYTKGIDLVEDGGEDATQEDKDCLHLLYSNRSMAHLDLCLVDEAMQDAECAIDAKPDYAKAYARRAIVLLDLFKNKEALIDLDKAKELDPTLDLSEERQRALGKVWVHNAYLKKQLELRKKHKCDYVLQIEYEGEELVEPRRVEHAYGRNMLAALDKTGHPQKRGFIAHVAGYPVDGIKRNIFDRIADEEKYNALVREQLQREFGPQHAFELLLPKSVVASSPSSDRFLFLVIQDCGADAYSPHLYPGRPRWFQPGEPRKFFDASKLSDPHLAYEGTLQELERDARLFAHYRQQHCEQNKDSCTGCGKSLPPNDDHQECMCSAIYCSRQCHAAHRPAHKGDCAKKMEKDDFQDLTFQYWVLVMNGALPFLDEPDTVALWKERNITSANSKTAFVDEYEFYKQEDGDRMAQQEASLHKRMQTSTKEQKANESQFKDPIVEHFARWGMRMSSILSNDSCARIWAKLELFAQVHQRCEQVSITLQSQPKEVAKKFCAFLKQHRKDDPNCQELVSDIEQYAAKM